MSKATLTFNIPEENEDFKLAINASEWASVVHHLEMELRQIVKYESEQHSEEAIQLIERVRNTLYSALAERNL